MPPLQLANQSENSEAKLALTPEMAVGANAAIHVENLGRRFGDGPAAIQAVRDVTFDVRRGDIFSLLGPNGAGKSTTIAMLAGLLRPSSGRAWITGHPAGSSQAREMLGVVPQEIALYEDMSARENLLFWGRMYNLGGPALEQRVNQVLALIGLEERQQERVDTFSGGMKRRVNIGAALLHEPALLIMDEPTVGIDPQSRRHILDGVKALNQAGMTVLYTTHYMEEAQELSDQIAIMDQGQIIARGTHDQLVALVGEQDRVDLTLHGSPDGLPEQWAALPGVAGVTRHETDQAAGTTDLTLLADDSNRLLPHLFETATAAGRRIVAVAVKEPNLETVFLHLTGRALRD